MADDAGDIGRTLAHHYTSVVSAVGLGLASVAVVLGRFPLAIVPLAGLAVALVFAGPIRRFLDPALPTDADPETARALEELRMLYAQGEIDGREYERRYDAVVEDAPRAVRSDDEAPDGGTE